MAEIAIETKALRKSYGDVEALRGLDLSVPAGSIFGFLGRNGAGKTTTIKVLLGMARATSGSASILGIEAPSVDIRRRTGFVSEEKDLYPYMTVAEIIEFTAPFFPSWRNDSQQRFLQRFDLPLDRKIKALSRGMRTKLALLLAICRGAQLLILDEPTSGLDPAAADEVLRILVAHAADDHVTIFFSSHQIAEVEQIADRVAIVDRGQTIVSGSLDDLRQSYRRIRIAFDGEPPANTFEGDGIVSVRRSGRVVVIFANGNVDAIVQRARAIEPMSFDVSPVTLKEIFLESVGEA